MFTFQTYRHSTDAFLICPNTRGTCAIVPVNFSEGVCVEKLSVFFLFATGGRYRDSCAKF